MKMSGNLVDPLLVLLRRYEAANAAHDAAADSDTSEAERDHLFAACKRTMDRNHRARAYRDNRGERRSISRSCS
jgi:hypothetical protein